MYTMLKLVEGRIQYLQILARDLCTHHVYRQAAHCLNEQLCDFALVISKEFARKLNEIETIKVRVINQGNSSKYLDPVIP